MATLRWSSQLTLSSPAQISRSLPGDKILLPPSALEQLLSAAPIVQINNTSPHPNVSQYTPTFDPFNPYTFAAESRARAIDSFNSSGGAQQQPQLPHPLTFRLVNPRNGRAVYAGIREFSAEEGHVSISHFLRHALGIDKEVENEEDEEVTVTVHAQQLPKGTYVRLRPLEAGYDPEDWKALLERHLRENFTTLTVGELLTVPSGRGRYFEFLIDKVAPEEKEGQANGICIVDTDLEVDIEPLNEEQARETLQKLSQKAARKQGSEKGSSSGGTIKIGQRIQGRVNRGDYVDYELDMKDDVGRLQLELEAADGADLDIFVSPFSAYQRAQPRSDEYVFGDMSPKSFKVLKLDASLPELTDAEKLFVSVHAFSLPDEPEEETEPPFEYTLRVVDAMQVDVGEETADSNEHNPDEVQCKNCQQWVPQRTLFLHENFCLRNNVLCPKCRNVFQKSSSEWQNHWHCEHDESYGNDEPSKEKHDYIFHKTHTCFNCGYSADSLPSLAHHRTTRCPGKQILCQFCHLVVPQQGDSDPDMNDPEVLLSGLTPHEIIDGGRTTECHLCNKIIRLRDMKTHLRHHDLERLSRPAPSICQNVNCGRTLKTPKGSPLGLCNICFAPLYTDAHDPEGKSLKRRIERRYLSQMLTGCGKTWCRNAFCKTGHERSSASGSVLPTSSKDILQIVKPLIDPINTKPPLTESGLDAQVPFYLCADETSQQRRLLGEMLAAENVYDIRWCLAALEGGGGDLEKAREWLSSWAPRKDEQR